MKQVITGGNTTLYINKYYEKNLTTGNETRYYYLGGRLVAMKQGSANVTFVHQDSLGGTSVMSDSSGNSINSINFYAFGGTRSGSVPTDIKFTGQRLDDTGLYYYGARYYDPSIGRFISPDIIVQSPANPQTLNRYSYVINNPLKYTDPTGHEWYDDGDGGMVWIDDAPEPEPYNPYDTADYDRWLQGWLYPEAETELPLGPSQPMVPMQPGPELPLNNLSSGFKVEVDISGAIIVYVPEGSLPAEIMGKLPTGSPLGAAGVTIYPFIFIRPGIIDDPRSIPDLVSHERAHIYQQELNLSFWPSYIFFSLFGHDRNPWEIQAQQISGYPPK